MTDNLKELRELIFKCEEVKKDVLELKLGCIVDIGRNSPYYVNVTSNLQSSHYNYNQHTERKYEGVQDIIEYRSNFTIDRTPVGEIKEIIGRDITLEDVLRVIEIKKPTIKISNIDSLDYGKIADITDEEKIGIMEMWKLGKPLQDQSEECIDSLIKLLK